MISNIDLKKIGLVFSGGGGKGAYEIGVWRALEEFNLCHHISASAGSSVGALNAALFAQGDLFLAEKMWREMATSDVLHLIPKSLATKIVSLLVHTMVYPPMMAIKLFHTLRTHGTFSRAGLLKLIKENLDSAKVTSPLRPVFATCREQGSMCIRHFSLVNADPQRLHSILLATSAIPVIFPPEKIDGKKWYDGGFPSVNGSNTPIKAVYDIGCRFIIAVLLDMDDLIDTSRFSDAVIIFVYPQKSNGDLFEGALDFDGIHADRRMDQGYQDTVRILEPIFRMGRAQAAYTNALELALHQQKEFRELSMKLEMSKAECHEAKENALASVKSFLEE